jgi:hypothetical protein
MFRSYENRSYILFLRDNKLFYKIVVLIFVCEFEKHETAFDLFKGSSDGLWFLFCFLECKRTREFAINFSYIFSQKK